MGRAQRPDSLPYPVAHLAQGSAAYGALTRLAKVHEGDTVFVTGAAGAVGTLAGQIARLLGAARVVGSTGSPDKAWRLRRELGYDAAVLRGAGPIDKQLAEAAPCRRLRLPSPEVQGRPTEDLRTARTM